jgi:myo-inositol catabolism protein IolC
LLRRTVFWDPLVNWRAGKITREAAAGEFARRYRNFAATFEAARASGKAPAS